MGFSTSIFILIFIKGSKSGAKFFKWRRSTHSRMVVLQKKWFLGAKPFFCHTIDRYVWHNHVDMLVLVESLKLRSIEFGQYQMGDQLRISRHCMWGQACGKSCKKKTKKKRNLVISHNGDMRATWNCL